MLTYIDFDMTKIQTTILGLTLFMLCSCGGKNTNPAIPYDNEIESQVEGVLSAMTLEEKVGQMTQLTSELIIEKGTHKSLGRWRGSSS